MTAKRACLVRVGLVLAVITAFAASLSGCVSGRASRSAGVPPGQRVAIDWSDPTDCEVAGRSGAVVAGPNGSATVGISMLICGGNAFDAAAATLLAQTVTEPTKYSFGGEVAIIVYDAARGQVEVLNGQGKAPALATIDYFKSIGGIPGPGKNLDLANDNRNATVPAALSAVCTLLDRYGTFTFEQIAAPTLRFLDGDPSGWRGDLAGTLRVLTRADVEARAAGGSRSDGIKAVLAEFYSPTRPHRPTARPLVARRTARFSAPKTSPHIRRPSRNQ